MRSAPIGGTGASVYGGYLEDTDKNAELRGPKWYGEPGRLGIAGQMMRDAHVRSSFNARTKPVRAAVWDFKAASSSPIDTEAADYARWAILERLNWDETVRTAQYYPRDGFALLEVTDDVAAVPTERFPLHPGKGTGIAITGFHSRPACTVSRWEARKGNAAQIAGVYQWLQGGDAETMGEVFIPSDRLVRFTYEQEAGYYAGFSALRSAYGAWKTKLTFLVLEAIRNERQAVGVPRIQLPEEATDEDVAQARKILSEMRSNEKGYLILPFGFQFGWETASTQGQDVAISTAIERCNRDIAFNVGAGFQLLGLSGSGGGGSYALAQTQSGQYQIELDTEARFITGAFNYGQDGWSPIRRLIDLNYGEHVACPLLVARNMPTRDWSQLLPVLTNLKAQGVIRMDKPLRAHVREIMYLPPEDPATLEEATSQSPFTNGQTAATTAPQADPEDVTDDEPTPAETEQAQP